MGWGQSPFLVQLHQHLVVQRHQPFLVETSDLLVETHPRVFELWPENMSQATAKAVCRFGCAPCSWSCRWIASTPSSCGGRSPRCVAFPVEWCSQPVPKPSRPHFSPKGAVCSPSSPWLGLWTICRQLMVVYVPEPATSRVNESRGGGTLLFARSSLLCSRTSAAPSSVRRPRERFPREPMALMSSVGTVRFWSVSVRQLTSWTNSECGAQWQRTPNAPAYSGNQPCSDGNTVSTGQILKDVQWQTAPVSKLNNRQTQNPIH